MIKNILFDFDGVILDSMKIKAEGFVELFPYAKQEIAVAIKQYHYAHGGVSRFEKIRYFSEELLNEKTTDEMVQRKAVKFAQIMQKKLFDECNLIRETVLFIQQNYQNYSMHVVSGAEHQELNSLCDFLLLKSYFLSIDGSPIKKEVLIEKVLNNYSYKRKETILIGDAITDYSAAKVNGIQFLAYNNLELKKFEEISYLESMEKIFDYL